MMDISALINRVARDVNEPGLQRDIEQACRNKQAFCFGDADTCVVLKLQERDGEKSILVWLGVSGGTGALEKFNPVVSDLTRAAGCSWFEFCTVRRGFIRAAGKLGFIRLSDDGQGRMWFRKYVG